MTNNVLIVGIGSKNDYLDAILNHCQPENLTIYSPSETWNSDLDDVLEQLQITGKKLEERDDYLQVDPNKIILFATQAGLETVQLLEYCISGKIELYVKHPTYKVKYGQDQREFRN